MPAITQLSRIKSDLFFTWTLLAASATRILDREEKKSLRPKICWGPQYMSKGDWHGFKFSFWKSAKKSCKWNQIGLKSKKIEALSSWQVTNPKIFQDSATKNFKVAISATRIFFSKRKTKNIQNASSTTDKDSFTISLFAFLCFVHFLVFTTADLWPSAWIPSFFHPQALDAIKCYSARTQFTDRACNTLTLCWQLVRISRRICLIAVSTWLM